MFSLEFFVFWAIVAIVFLVVIGGIVAKFIGARYTTTRPRLSREEKEQRRRAMFPALDPSSSRVVSVVIPCFNEQDRLAPMLCDTIAYMSREARRAHDYRLQSRNNPKVNGNPADQLAIEAEMIDAFEIIVVDDCSRDNTVAVARKAFAEALALASAEGYALTAAEGAKVPFVSIIESKPNHGKGYAVRRGFFEAVGDYVLMADGDNATQVGEVSKLLKAIGTSSKRPFEIAVGSRAHLEHDSIAQRTFGRTVLMVAFHIVVKVTYAVATLGSICVIRDTQCGFKIFHREKCEPLFLSNRLERWAFDVELLVLARRQKLRVVEVCVNWTEVPGSKVCLSGMVQMGLECLLMCFTYPMGIWSVAPPLPANSTADAAERKRE